MLKEKIDWIKMSTMGSASGGKVCERARSASWQLGAAIARCKKYMKIWNGIQRL